MKRLLTWASVIGVSLLLSATPCFGQMSDDYGFPIETESYAGRQSNFSGSRVSGLFGLGLFRSGANTGQWMTRGYRTVQHYCQSPAVTSSASSWSFRYGPSVKSDIPAAAPIVADRSRRNSQYSSLTASRASANPTILISSRPCVPNR